MAGQQQSPVFNPLFSRYYPPQFMQWLGSFSALLTIEG
jgi:hypothetical protein